MTEAYRALAKASNFLNTPVWAWVLMVGEITELPNLPN
jgi:hypothetical protein